MQPTIDSLRSTITSLEGQIDSLEKWLGLMTALVVLGLILEYIPEIWILKPRKNEKKQAS